VLATVGLAHQHPARALHLQQHRVQRVLQVEQRPLAGVEQGRCVIAVGDTTCRQLGFEVACQQSGVAAVVTGLAAVGL
jgi:hypothetical protein